jgi:hypothetical protein
MKNFVLFFLLVLLLLPASASVIEAGISVEHVPKVLFGTWRVNAKLDRTNSLKTFRPQSVDMWELSRFDNFVKLNNPISGANQTISILTVENNLIVFSRRVPYDNNKVLTDTVTIRLDKNNFSGINTLKLESFSLIDNHLLKTETATYHITGEKISGDNVLEP